MLKTFWWKRAPLFSTCKSPDKSPSSVGPAVNLRTLPVSWVFVQNENVAVWLMFPSRQPWPVFDMQQPVPGFSSFWQSKKFSFPHRFGFLLFSPSGFLCSCFQSSSDVKALFSDIGVVATRHLAEISKVCTVPHLLQTILWYLSPDCLMKLFQVIFTLFSSRLWRFRPDIRRGCSITTSKRWETFSLYSQQIVVR